MKKYISHCRNSPNILYRKIVEICKFDIPNTHINDPSWLSSGTSIKSDGVKLVYSKIIYLCENLNQKYLKKNMFCINTDLVNSKNELKSAKYLINNYYKQLSFPSNC